jgi:hypothetical protein
VCVYVGTRKSVCEHVCVSFHACGCVCMLACAFVRVGLWSCVHVCMCVRRVGLCVCGPACVRVGFWAGGRVFSPLYVREIHL